MMFTVRLIGYRKYKRDLKRWERATKKFPKEMVSKAVLKPVAKEMERDVEHQYKSKYSLLGWPTPRVERAVKYFIRKMAILLTFTSVKAKDAKAVRGVVRGMRSVIVMNTEKYHRILEQKMMKLFNKLYKGR